MPKWEVTTLAGPIVVEAASLYINGTSTLMFLEKPPAEPEPAPDDSASTPGKKPKKKSTSLFNRSVTVRAFNAGAWQDVRLIR